MVTHNVKLCSEADMIFLINNGSIVDTGNYSKIKENNLYKKLLNEI